MGHTEFNAIHCDMPSRRSAACDSCIAALTSCARTSEQRLGRRAACCQLAVHRQAA